MFRKSDDLGLVPDFNIKECSFFQELIHSIYIEHLLLSDFLVSSEHTNDTVRHPLKEIYELKIHIIVLVMMV